MNLDGIRQIGKIINTHGLKGDLKIELMTDDHDLFRELKKIIILDNKKRKEIAIAESRPFKTFWLFKLEGVNDLNQAEIFKGKEIFIEESKLRPLDEDEFYIDDLMGSEVFSTKNELLGKITDYFLAGEQGVCEVSKDGSSFLFPATKEVLKKIDTDQKKVQIELLEGLRD